MTRHRNSRNYHLWGEYNVYCEGTGFKLKSHEVSRRWDGIWVRTDLLEERQPQDLIRPVREGPGPRDARPEPETIWITSQVLPSSL